MREEDILLWPDGFWCFRFELHLGVAREYPNGLPRGYQHRVVPYQSEEWHKLSRWPLSARDMSQRPFASP